MIKETDRNGWGAQLVDRPIESRRCGVRRESANTLHWRVDDDLPRIFRALTEGGDSWRVMDIDSILDSNFDRHEHALSALQVAARAGEERAFLQAIQEVRWKGLSAEDFSSAIRLALEAGAYRAARDIAKKGFEYHPQNTRLRKYAHVLAPAKVMSSNPASDGSRRRNNREWLKAHGREYSGRWLAIRDGELLGADDSLKALVERIGSTEDVLLTTP